jgi:PAS domain S-box-containing protein
LADNMPVMCWIADASGYIYWYNRRWYEYTGTTPAQMEGWGWQSVHDPQTLGDVLERWRASLVNGEPFDMVFPLRSAAGDFRPFLTRIQPYRDQDGRITHWFGNNVEISAQRAAEKALKRLNDSLETRVQQEVAAKQEAQERAAHAERISALGRLAGGIAHDFNNALQVIVTGVRLLRAANVPFSQQTQLLDGMERAARNAAELVQRLLTFARRQQLKPRAFDVNARLLGMARLLQESVGPLIEFEVDLQPNLSLALADPDQFEVALLNLVMNARDAMPNGGKLTLRTRETCDAEGFTFFEQIPFAGHICLCVADTGVGMAPQIRSRVFEPFFTTKETGKGTGLGLPQVLGFVRQSEGDVGIRSEAGRGATIAILLPRAAGEAPDEPLMKGVQEAASDKDASEGGGPIVLVVEDNLQIADFTCLALESLGYQVLRASDASSALALVRSGQRVDAVFSDVVMPGEFGGAELASILSKERPEITLVLATGHSDRLELLRDLPIELLRKPYFPEDLVAALQRALKKRSA